MPSPELAAARDHAIVVELAHEALLAVTGEDAAAFLHAQFTNDVQALAADQAQWNGWCSAKGRLLATFLLARRADGFLLMLPSEIATPVAKRLGMFVLRAKAKIQDVSAGFARFGVAGPHAARAVQGLTDVPAAMRVAERDGVATIALDARRFVVLAPAERADAVRQALQREAAPASIDAWTWTTVQAGIPRITTATQEAFVPQMANFELVGGVSFRKGCYPGQEIVARTQYRGILKRRMALAHVDSPTRPQPGDPLYGAAFGEQAAGEVVEAAPAPEGGWDLLAVAQIGSLRSRDLRFGATDGPPLDIRSHPAADAE